MKHISVADSTLQRLSWLEKFRMLDIPKARLWTYGYNGGNKNSVSDHARDLAVKLKREIGEGNYKDPIIFVAHGLGTILVKSVSLHQKEYLY